MYELAKKQVQELVEKATKADKAAEAINFSQAALNAAHAFQVLEIIDKK
jgi:hypothetical protein